MNRQYIYYIMKQMEDNLINILKLEINLHEGKIYIHTIILL
jgi:hypothetical protein